MILLYLIRPYTSLVRPDPFQKNQKVLTLTLLDFSKRGLGMRLTLYMVKIS